MPQYLDKIEYIGDPVKAIMPDGGYLWTLIANDIPVTSLEVFRFLGIYRFENPNNGHRSPRIQFKLNVEKESTFIGESVIIYNLLDEMRINSSDANATVFKIEVSDAGERISMVVSDDGEGIQRQEVKDNLFNASVSTRPAGAGLALWFNGRPQLQKMGADIKYKGVGIDGKGASFELTFLKRIPT